MEEIPDFSQLLAEPNPDPGLFIRCLDQYVGDGAAISRSVIEMVPRVHFSFEQYEEVHTIATEGHRVNRDIQPQTAQEYQDLADLAVNVFCDRFAQGLL